jgi:hypothetical protein
VARRRRGATGGLQQPGAAQEHGRPPRLKLRAEKVERSFALILDIGGLRCTWLRGIENVEKRYLIQVAAYNLELVIRHRFGAGTPRQAVTLFWLVINGRQGLGIAIWTILAPSRADQRTTARASPVVLICLWVLIGKSTG